VKTAGRIGTLCLKDSGGAAPILREQRKGDVAVITNKTKRKIGDGKATQVLRGFTKKARGRVP